MYDVAFSFLTAFTLTYFAIPSIIHVARSKNLMAEPGERHSHRVRTPSLGGIGIFAGVVFSIVLWTPFDAFGSLQYILCSFVIVFLIGAKDDLVPMSPYKKLIGEIVAAAIIVFKADVQLTSLYGIFGIYELPAVASYSLSIFTILVIINAFNLIDGINGLSGSIATLISVILGIWFIMTGNTVMSIIAFSLAGAVFAFLKYNFTPAQIFMGDTGALLIGLVCSILAIQFIESNKLLPDANPYKLNAVPAVAIGILILPLFDTLRVFVTRALKGRSPLSPDRTHIHHLLIDAGLTHMRATALLVGVNMAFIFFVFYFQNLGTITLLILTLGLATLMTAWLYYRVMRKKYNKQAV
ncbi:MAG: undecaprenyl/decaprenyl-phosphate alpha-N-acetylglucosaminyl 1-phosphate transferase [Saprospirales bacterium]|nr:undecaprenyl/decaprenyl-phosphate alpha-N-acetylglucosaminyl 1-phosphate transferase [Saprospirales bacterium]